MKEIIYLIIIVITFTSCLDEIELETSTAESKIVVDGSFSDNNETQVIKLSYSTIVERQIVRPVTGANVSVVNDLGKQLQFTEVMPGEYNAVGQADKARSYYMQAILPNGEVLTSRTQSVPSSIGLDSISIVDSLTTYINEDGNERRRNAIHFFANGSADNLAEDLSIRYKINTVYQVSEIICSPLVPVTICYIYDDERPQSVQLLEIDASDAPITFTQNIYFRPIDFYFGEIFGLDVGVLSYNDPEYQYWKNLKATFDQNGDITDVIPGRLVGNVQSSEGNEILGIFSVVGKTRTTKLIRNADFPTRQVPYCGLPGLQPWPLPDECCFCLAFPNSSTIKPDFWP